MDITFRHTDMHFHPGVAVLFLAEVDGTRVDVRIEWGTLEALSGASSAEAVREFVKRETPSGVRSRRASPPEAYRRAG